MKDNVITPSSPIYSDEVKAWIDAFDSLGLSDNDYITNSDKIQQKPIADLTRDETLTLITAIIRGERFCEGRIAKALEDGTLEELCVHLHEVTKQTKTSILLSDLLKNNGIDPKDVVLIRHVLSRDHANTCFKSGFIKEYTQIQGLNKPMLKSSKYWMVFISTSGTNAKFYCMYSYKGFSHISEHEMPAGFPFPEMYREDANLYELEESDL
uniref:DUF6508 domain-containing protein n=1 Tax=uncultured Ruminococcus sp. TaxID=165186 RepID=UPI0025D7053F